MRDNPRTGRPAEAVTPTMLTNVEVFFNKDRRMTLREVANRFSIRKVSVQPTLREDIGMSKESAK